MKGWIRVCCVLGISGSLLGLSLGLWISLWGVALALALQPNSAFAADIDKLPLVSSRPEAGLWNLPTDLSVNNTVVKFEVETTWHTVHGKANEASGRAWLENPADFNTVRLEIKLPVVKLDTNDEDRDATMQESMEAEQFPDVHFVLTRNENLCSPQSLEVGSSCDFKAFGDLTIRDVTRTIEIAAAVSRDPQGAFTIRGKGDLLWTDFGVRDPSILIAKVHPEVAVEFSLQLARRS